MMGDTFWKMIRQKAGDTQVEFARKMNVSVDTLRTWEGGRADPGMASATKAAAAVGMSPVRVYVGSHVDTATKAVERGEGSRGKILRSAAKFADLSEQADEQEDAEALRMGAEELLKLARQLTTDSASKSAEENTSGRDYLGRVLSSQKAESVELPERDLTGRKSSKPLDRKAKTGERGIQKSQRADTEDRGRDLLGRKLGK